MSRRKPKNKRPAPEETAHKRQKHRLEWWKIAIPALAALAVGVLPFICQKPAPEDPPRFALLKPITRPDSGLQVVCLNNAARKNKPLSLEFDGVRLLDPVTPTRLDEETWLWRFTLDPEFLTPQKLTDGLHKVVVGFDGNFSDTLTVEFDTRIPLVQGEVSPVEGEPDQRILKGKAASPSQIPADTLAVDVVFNLDGEPVHLPLPARRVTDQETGVTFFEFEARIANLPKIKPEDPRFSEDFFAFRVKDGAGNFYYDVKSYAQFMAPGRNRFGAGNIAELEMLRLPEDLQRQRFTFRFYPKPPPSVDALDGEPLIHLKATLIGDNIERLEWTGPPPELASDNPVTMIYKNREEPLVAIGVNSYDMPRKPGEPPATFQVAQSGKDGEIYTSNKASAAPQETPQPPATAQTDPPEDALPLPLDLDAAKQRDSLAMRTNLSRLKPSFLSRTEAEAMIKRRGFYDRGYNPNGKGLDNRFTAREISGAKIVQDEATGLTWQQSGSTSLAYAQAQAYIDSLNQIQFAGFRDWRLPTLEEAMSLMEPKENAGGLFIDEIFSAQQRWIWTADKYSASSAWVVLFSSGFCSYFHVVSNVFNVFVRAVR